MNCVSFVMSKKRENSHGDADESKIYRDQGVLDHYSKRGNVSQKQRQSSPIFGIKCMNNWIKDVLMKRFLVVDHEKSHLFFFVIFFYF